jgi:F420H(2)-dependent quinone reductase
MVKTSNRNSAVPRSPFAMQMRNITLSLLLRSPFHKRVSNTLLLLAFRGRKSGKKYCFPVGYIQQDKNELLVLTPKKRSWWKNFRDGAPVTVSMQGQKRQGSAEVIYDDLATIAQGITMFLRHNPQAAPMYHVELNASGEPTPETLKRILPHWVVVRIHLA